MSTSLASPASPTTPDSVYAAASSTLPSLPIPASPVELTSLLTPFTPDAFANGFATLIGALLGAMLAYLFQLKLQRSQEHKQALVAAHRLMFSLLQQINTIILIQRDYVYTELGNPGRFISIPATPSFDTKKNVLELPELSFLLEDKEARHLLYDFYIAQENYVEALNQWNLRSAFHLERLQSALAASGIGIVSVVTDQDIRKALGNQTYSHGINATNNCIVTLRRAFEKLSAVKTPIRAYIVNRFRTNDFADFDFPETWGLVEAKSEEANKT